MGHVRRYCILIVTLVFALTAFAQTTPNLGLQLPNYNSPNWGTALNFNFSRIDGYLSGAYQLPAGVTFSGITSGDCVSGGIGGTLETTGSPCSTTVPVLLKHNGASLSDQNLLNFNDTTPAAPSGEQNVLFQTDTNGDLSAYVPQTAGVYLPLTGGTLTGALESPDFINAVGSVTVNPKAYGAKGDGVTDDGPALIAMATAINAMTAPSISVYFPAGTYMVNAFDTHSQPITNTLMNITRGGVHFEGPGEIELIDPSTPYSQQFGVASGSIFYWNYINFASGGNDSVSNMTFNSNGAAVVSLACTGSYGCFWASGASDNAAGSSNYMVSNNRFLNLGGWPVISAANNTQIHGNYVEQSKGFVCDNGSTGCSIVGNVSIDSTDAPFAVNGIPGLPVSNFVIADNIEIDDQQNGDGIDVTGANEGVVSGNYITGKDNYCILVDRSGGMYQPESATYIPSGNVSVVNNMCINNNDDGAATWPLTPEIMIGDPYSGPSGGAAYTPGSTAVGVLVEGNKTRADTATGMGVGIGYGVNGVQVIGNYFNGCGNGGSIPCSSPAVRIEDMGADNNITYLDNTEDNSNSGSLVMNSTTDYYIAGNNFSDNVKSGVPSYVNPQASGQWICLENGTNCPANSSTATAMQNRTAITVGTTAIGANTCTSTTVVAITGVTTASTFVFTPTTDVSSITGWSPAGTGQLYFDAWPTAGDLNYKVCNPTAASITPSASTTWNVSVQ